MVVPTVVHWFPESLGTRLLDGRDRHGSMAHVSLRAHQLVHIGEVYPALRIEPTHGRFTQRLALGLVVCVLNMVAVMVVVPVRGSLRRD